jgi:hypothetical protein
MSHFFSRFGKSFARVQKMGKLQALTDYTEGRIFDIIFREFHKRKEKENVENHDSG